MTKQYIHFFCFLVCIFLFMEIKTFPQTCDHCNSPRVGIYDPSVLVPKPSETDPTYGILLPKWWQLFRVGDAMREYFHNQDGTGGCIFFNDIHVFVSDTSIWGNKMKFGTEWAQTAPFGPIDALDYLVESSVSGSDGSYQITASLQSAITRETVASGSINFTDMWDAPTYAQQLAAQSFSPLFNKIREWEKNKREEDTEVAIGTDNITIKPAKTKIETTEQLTVDFALKDCDGETLRNKKLQLIEGEAYGMKLDGPQGGHFAAEYVYTDDEGKAQATFMADNNPGVGILRAYFIYKYPSGHNGLAGGEAVINISQAPVEYWEISGSIMNSYKSVRDTAWSNKVAGYTLSGFYQDASTKIGQASIKGLIKNETDESGKFSFIGDEPIEAPFANGSTR